MRHRARRSSAPSPTDGGGRALADKKNAKRKFACKPGRKGSGARLPGMRGGAVLEDQEMGRFSGVLDAARRRVGAIYPETGAIHPEIGAIYPEIGAIYPEIGAIYPEIGAIYPEIGAIHLELGAIYPEIGAIHLELGAIRLELGVTHLETGAIHLETGKSRPGRGATVRPESSAFAPSIGLMWPQGRLIKLFGGRHNGTLV